MKPAFSNSYEAARSLNNISVSLIERRCFAEAAKVSTDALHVLQSAMAGESISASEIEHLTYRSSLYLQSDDSDDSSESACILDDVSELSDFGDLDTTKHKEDEQQEEEDIRTSCDRSYCVLNQYGEYMAVGDLPSLRKRKPVFYIQEPRTPLIGYDEEPVSAAFSELTLALLMHNQGQIYRSLASCEVSFLQEEKKRLENGARSLFGLSRLVLQEMKTPVSPMITVALHQTMLDMEGSLGLLDISGRTKRSRTDCTPRLPNSFRCREREQTSAKAA